MNTAKSFLRSAKNFTFGFTDMQIKTREATSNDPGGPTTHSMNEIASGTFDELKFREVMSILRKRLNDHGKNWRHVYKSLLILDYCIQFGSERVIDWALTNIQLIKTLKEFQYIDSHGRDHGAAVRQKSRELTALLMDMDQVNANRENGRFYRQRADNWGMNGSGGGGGGLRRSLSSLSLNNNNNNSNSRTLNSSLSTVSNGGLSEAEALKVALEASRADILASQQQQREKITAQSSVSSCAQGKNIGQLVDLMGDDDEESATEEEEFQQANYSHQMNAFASIGGGGGHSLTAQQLQYNHALQQQQLRNGNHSNSHLNGQFNGIMCGNNSPSQSSVLAFNGTGMNNHQSMNSSSEFSSSSCQWPQQQQFPRPPNASFSLQPPPPFTHSPQQIPTHNLSTSSLSNAAAVYSTASMVQGQSFSQTQLLQPFYGSAFEAACSSSSSALFPPPPLATDPFQAGEIGMNCSNIGSNPFLPVSRDSLMKDDDSSQKPLVDLRPVSLLTDPFSTSATPFQEGKKREHFQ